MIRVKREVEISRCESCTIGNASGISLGIGSRGAASLDVSLLCTHCAKDLLTKLAIQMEMPK